MNCELSTINCHRGMDKCTNAKTQKWMDGSKTFTIYAPTKFPSMRVTVYRCLRLLLSLKSVAGDSVVVATSSVGAFVGVFVVVMRTQSTMIRRVNTCMMVVFLRTDNRRMTDGPLIRAFLVEYFLVVVVYGMNVWTYR